MENNNDKRNEIMSKALSDFEVVCKDQPDWAEELAKQHLIEAGILCKNGAISEEYKDVFVKLETGDTLEEKLDGLAKHKKFEENFEL